MEEIFYIYIDNNRGNHENEADEFHIERIFDKEIIYKIIFDSINSSKNYTKSIKKGLWGQNIVSDYDKFRNDWIIVSNDPNLLNIFLCVINEDELKFLSGLEGYNSKNIRLNENIKLYQGDTYMLNFDKTVYDYFVDIKNKKIYSASMIYSTIRLGHSNYFQFEGWFINRKLYYLDTPEQYRNLNFDGYVWYDYLIKCNLTDLNKKLNFELTNYSLWENRKDELKYYDKITKRRAFIKKQLLEEINTQKNYNNIELEIFTTLSETFYIEYYIKNFKMISDEETNEYFDYEHNELSSDYNWLSEASGTDDPEIMNDVYWNID